MDPSIVRHDLAYPAMLVFLPSGLLGLVVASLAAAYMSTISTHLNWGASYVVDDVYRRFRAPDREERHYVRVGRITTLGLIVLSSVVALWLENAVQAFQILLQIGAGTGLVFLLRWFWRRINAWSEIAAMVVSFAVALWFELGHERLGFEPWPPTLALVVGVAVTTAGWLAVTFLTPPTEPEVLEAFEARVRPRRGLDVRAAFLSWFLGCVAVYGALFGTGYVLYARALPAVVCLGVAAGAAAWLFRVYPRVAFRG